MLQAFHEWKFTVPRGNVQCPDSPLKVLSSGILAKIHVWASRTQKRVKREIHQANHSSFTTVVIQ